MLIITAILSLIFGAIGFLVTKANAQYILAGYNTMSERDRKAVDIDPYLRFFKRFHIFLALSMLGGVFLIGLINDNWASVFMTVYPLGAYLFFLIKGQSFYKGIKNQKSGTYLVGGILVAVIAALAVFSSVEYRSSELTLDGQKLKIKGSYGLTLNRQEIREQRLVDQLPPIAYKANGFAAGDYAKGRFKTKDGRLVWLFVNKTSGPFLLIESEKGAIFYNHDELSMQELSRDLAQWLKVE